MKDNTTSQIPEIYFRKMKDIEEKLCNFIEKQDELNENLIIFNDYLRNQNILENKYELKSFLYIIVAIANNCHRSKHFFSKIELILKNIQAKVQNYFTNFEIFNIFIKNKRLLLFLFNSKIIMPTEEIYSIFINNPKCIEGKYIEYFFPEFQQFMDCKRKESIRDQIQELKEKTSIDEFNKKREKGENDNYLYHLIQNDLVIDFITYVEKNNISLSYAVDSSIYETNLFLINKHPSLIEYSAFYGSIQILRYLYQRNLYIKTSIWPYAIHGRNAEIIHFLEENEINTKHRSFQYLIIESIKCHHNEIAEYFRNNFCEEEKIYDFYLYRKALKYYNFQFLTDDMVNSLINSCKINPKLNIPYYLSKYDYFLIVEYLLNCTTEVKKFLFFKKSINILDVNYQYTIYKPVAQSNDDIVSYIAIKNGDIESEPEVEIEEEKRKEMESYLYVLKERKKYAEYKYNVETSTILNIAVRKGNIDIIKLLLNSRYIDVNIKSKIKSKKSYQNPWSNDEYYLITEERTALHEAVESGYAEIFQFLIQNKSFNVDSIFIKTTEYSDFHSTANNHYDENYTETILHYAIERGYIGIIKLLLSNPKININMRSKSKIRKGGGCVCYYVCHKEIERSSLFYAIENENINVIDLLLAQPEIDVNFGIIEYLSDYSVDHEILQEKTPLFLAVEKQNLEIVKLLLKHPKTVVNYVSKAYIYHNSEQIAHRMTAKELASEKPNKEIKLLLK